MSVARPSSPWRTRGVDRLPRGLVRALADVVSRRDDIADILVFGSYARGEADRESDIDLCVVFDEERFVGDSMPSEAHSLLDEMVASSGKDFDIVCVTASELADPGEGARAGLMRAIVTDGRSVCSMR